MIAKPPLPGDEVDIQDAPPSYDALEDVPPRPVTRDEKAAGPSTLPPPPPTSPTLSLSAKATGKRPSTWWNFSPSARAVKEVRTTVLGLLRDLVKQGDAQGALGVLESCADACKTYNLSLSALLQEKAIEGHTPLYWAIINRPTLPPRPEDPDLVSAVLSHAAPLTDATVDELRLACLHTSDHALFQKLRRSPAFSPLTGREELITGGSVPIDDVEVEDVKDDEGAFLVKLRIPMFQKRMRISESIHLEFIAKGRLWELSFLITKEYDRRTRYKSFKPGSWVVKLALLPHSPPTWVDSRLVIEDPRARGRPPPRSPLSTGPSTSLFEAVMLREDPAYPAPPKVRPTVELRLKTHEQLSAPSSSRSHDAPMILVSIEESALANSLQFNGCPYLESDGSLVARLEAKLAPPGSDCVIC